MARSLELLRREGSVLIDNVELPDRRQTGSAPLTLMLFEFKAGLNAYLSRLGPSAPVRTLQEIIVFNEEHRAVEMPYFGQELFIQAQEKGDLTDPEYLDALNKSLLLAREEGIDKAMDEHDLDALVAPTGGPAWKIDLLNGDPSAGGSSSPAARAGYPNITVPAGNARGLPLGISFFGRAWSEPQLLRIAYAFEQSAHARISPRFRESIP
jgi:amidase